jgi:hypothetical protein
VHDLHELLGRLDGLEREHAHRLLLHPLEKLARELEADVGLEQHAAHFAQPFLDVALREDTLAAQTRERLAEFLGQFVEHGGGNVRRARGRG